MYPVILILAIAYLPAALLLFLAAWLAYRRKRRGAAAMGVLLLAYLGVLVHVRLMPGFAWYHDLDYTRQVFGARAVLREVASYETPRSWHGDGYSVWVYRVPERVSNVFREHPERLRGYPRPSLRPDWRVHGWTPAPSARAHATYLDWVIGDDPEGLGAEIEAVLRKPGAWYAFLVYEASPGFTLNMDLFVVDPVTNRFYVVNLNT